MTGKDGNSSKDDAGMNQPSQRLILGKDKKGSSTDKAADALRRLNLQNLFSGMVRCLNSHLIQGAGQEKKETNRDMAKHRFWQTQPVPSYGGSTSHSTNADDKSEVKQGPIEPEDASRVSKEPGPLIEGFEWVTLDLSVPKELEDVWLLLNQNYVEDQEAMFRFNYSQVFLSWALKSPGWRGDWHIGIRATQSRKLVAFISAVPCVLRVRGDKVNCSEVNFMCVHKKLRAKRLAPVLIREITRRCNLANTWQAIYTGGIYLPTPVSTCRYFHRAINWTKLHEVGFSPLPPGSTVQRQVLRYKLPEKTATPGWRPMIASDVDAVLDLLRRYLGTMDLAQEFTRDEVAHWFLHEVSDAERIVFSYVVEVAGKVTDFVSFYCIESTVIGNDKHKTIKVAYLYYYASEAAFDNSNGPEKKVLKTRLNNLISDALIEAKLASFDVFNALTLLDNPLFLVDQKFGTGDGFLYYYLFNFLCGRIPGGVNEKGELDTSSGVGVVML